MTNRSNTVARLRSRGRHAGLPYPTHTTES